MTYVHGTHPREQARLSLMNRLINEPSLEALALRPGDRVLDVGCGLGEFTRIMARRAGPGRVVGVERDPEQLATGRRLAAEAGEGDLADLRAGDALDLPLADTERGGFDVVYSRFLLEHLAEPLAAVRQMVEAVRLGGRVALQDDDHDVMRLWPPCPELMDVWQAYVASYERQGTDGLIGRKLPALLHEAGARPSRVTQLFYGGCNGDPTFGDIMRNALEVLEGARAAITATGLMGDADIDRSLDATRRWTELPGASFWYVMCYAEGTKDPTCQASPSPSAAATGTRSRSP